MVLVWLQNDLRLDDHEALCQANGGAAALLPVYVFDPRDYEKVACLFLSQGAGHLVLQDIAYAGVKCGNAIAYRP